MALQNFWKSASNAVKVILVILAVIFLYSIYHSFTSDNAMGVWRDKYNAFRDTAAAVTIRADSLDALSKAEKIRADSLDKLVKIADGEINDLTDAIDDLERELIPISTENNATFTQLTQGQNVEQVVARENAGAEPWVRLSFNLRNETSLLRANVDTLHQKVGALERRHILIQAELDAANAGWEFQTQRANILQGIVDSIPPAPPSEKLFGIIPLPSRKASYMLGFASGVATVYAVVK